MRPSEGTEAEYLDSQDNDLSFDDISLRMPAIVEKARERYELAKKTLVGQMIRCPACNSQIKKTAYNKTFCSNQRTRRKGQSSCKDNYWNTVDTRKWNYLRERMEEE